MFRFDEFYRHNITESRQQLGAERSLNAFAERCGLLPATAPRGDLTLTLGAEDYFDCAYAYMHASAQRDAYERLFRVVPSLPTLPLAALRDLAFKGEVLQSLHLLSARGVRLMTFPVSGDNRVTRAQFWPGERGRQGRIVINDRQFFGEVPSAVWHFRVGGVQPCARYLSDRVGERLTLADLTHLHEMIAAIFETLGVRDEIDAVLANASASQTDAP